MRLFCGLFLWHRSGSAVAHGHGRQRDRHGLELKDGGRDKEEGAKAGQAMLERSN